MIGASNFSQYLSDHHPHVLREIVHLPTLKALAVLNRETGLDIQKTDLFEGSLEEFKVALEGNRVA